LATAVAWNDANEANTPFVRGYIVEYDTKPTVAIRLSEDIEVCWASRTNTLYTVQYSPTLTGDAWDDLFTHVQGTGDTNCIIDPAPIGETQRYYRVKIE
jgi:hypothetical protein